MTDELPLPEPKPHIIANFGRVEYTADDMRAYGDARAAAERERCAKVCEDAKALIWEYHEPQVKQTALTVCENLAAAIRKGE
jgi:hypothetical protein